MTEAMLRQFATAPADYEIEGDASAASYFLALPLVTGGALVLPNYGGPLQGDVKFSEVIGAVARDLRGIDRDFREFSDTFLTLAALAPLLDGPTKISGIAHTRKQETDRVAGMARELKKRPGNPSAPAHRRRRDRDLPRPPLCHELRHPRLP
jgi:3-phosphoshikimate 1-carboxyvinyltransferase